MSEAGSGGELCGVCAAPLRAGARFCGRCGAEQGLMVARDAGAGRELREPSRLAARLDPRGLTVALVVYFAGLSPMLYMLARHAPMSLGDIDAIEWLIGAAGLVGVAVLGRAGLRTLAPGRWRARDLVLAVAATAAVLGLVEGAARIVPSLFLDERTLMGGFGLGLGGVLLHTAVIPAVTEEVAFRGAILGGLRGVLGDRTAIIVSALMFAIMHLSVPSLIHLSLLGLILGTVRVRSGSVWPGIFLHAGYNAAIVLLAR